jgi:hypothetical protein
LVASGTPAHGFQRFFEFVLFTTHGGAIGDSESGPQTLLDAGVAVAEQIATPSAKGHYQIHEQGLCEVVTDKGYHSGAGLAAMPVGCATYASVPHQPAALSGKAKPSNKRPKDQHAEGILLVHHVEEQKPGEVAQSRQDLKKGSLSVVIRASIA